MPAKSKPELIAVSRKEFGKLSNLLDDLPKALRLQPDGDGISPKDIVGHRAHWIGLFLGWYRDGEDGVPVALPAPGYKWNDLVRYNADLRARQAGMGWDAARGLLGDNHDALMRLIGSLDDAQLYGDAMKGGGNAWTTGRWAEASGPSHYRSATKYLRHRLRAAPV